MRLPTLIVDPAKHWMETYALSDVDHGRYLRVLIVLWDCPGGKAPNDAAWWGAKTLRSVEAFESEIKPILLKFCKTNGNSWWHPEMVEDQERQRRLSDRGSVGGKALAEKKKLSSQTPARRTKQAPASKLQPEGSALLLSSSTVSSSSKSLFEEERISIGPPPIISLPVTGNGEFPISQAMITEFQDAYPAVDIIQQLREMRAWSISNPSKRKTSGGAMRFVNTWLARKQNGASKGPAFEFPKPTWQPLKVVS